MIEIVLLWVAIYGLTIVKTLLLGMDEIIGELTK